MTIRKTVAITAALLLLVLNTVSAQDEWDALDDDEEESSDDEAYADDEYDDEGDEKPPKPIEYPDQIKDEEGFIEPAEKKEQKGDKTASEEELLPVPASAHKEDKPISAGLLVGYGFSFEQGDMNRLGLGFGVRGGYTFDFGIYAGAKFVYYLGGEETTKTSNIMTVGVEGGYKLELDPVFFLPSLELGLSMLMFDDSTGILDESSNDFYLAPGLAVIYPIDMIFVGLDLSIPIILKDPTISGLSLMATGGLMF